MTAVTAGTRGGRTHQRLKHETAETLEDLRLASRLQLEKSPYMTLAATFAAGWVLGGGISPRLLRMLFGVGSRFAATMLLRQALEEITDRALAARPERASRGSRPRTEPAT
jgi:hypothetical protein